MSYTCKSCGHNQPETGKCEVCKDTDLINESGEDPWKVAKERGDILTLSSKNAGSWAILDANGATLETSYTLSWAEYLCRGKGMAFKVEAQ